MGGEGARKGMDADKVRAIADRLSHAQRSIAEAAGKADTAVRTLRPVWTGDDAKTFFGAWPALRESLESGALQVESLQKRLREELGDQEQTSGVGGGGGGGGDRDGDGIPNSRDRDSDNDGTPDDRDTDDDNDGTPDAEDPDRPGIKAEVDLPEDADRDGYDDTTGEEVDSDGDGTPDLRDPDGVPGGPTAWNKNWEKEWVDNGAQHKADPRVGLSVDLGSAEKEFWDKSVYDKTWGDEDGTHATVDLLSTEGKGEGSFSLGRDGLTTAGTLTAGAYLAKVNGAWSNSHGTSASGSAYVGGEANAKAGVSLGLDGFRGNAGVDAFVGGKAEGSINQSVGPVDVGVGGEISYGVGAHAEVDGEFSADRVGVSVDIGATLGIGGGLELDLGFDPPW
ncbi:hypothetical protein [Phycicoccus sp. SLBN-51]|uniref:WXG100 family type VII secretion target n=1 Tax=Phycicoccus sp. SLBN-51 TaxID=2768447 RepID=UPI0011729965|nr:hypothetical protein [Phycicoccus sp. SLBN-51]TQJ48834.1 hypothetical protein FBY26_0497 [Phycicoccus sp. SLBN-51]